MPKDIFSIPLKTITGEPTSLANYKGKVMLIVNVASKCGLTPQYDGLEELYENYREKGLVVLGFPANEFGAQEPGSNEQIQEFCRATYGVKFPMFEKIVVKGVGIHPLYETLTNSKPISWNFEKFLVGKDGKILARFEPKTEPQDPALVLAVENALRQ